MLQQLIIGSALIVITIGLQAIFIILALKAFANWSHLLGKPPGFLRSVLSLSLLVLWLVLGATCSVWIWSGVFVWLEALSSLDDAVYFSIVTFTTLGYGDVTLGDEYRLLSGLCAVNGLVVFGLNTAYTFDYFLRLRHVASSHKSN